jgi:transposase-like protein
MAVPVLVACPKCGSTDVVRNALNAYRPEQPRQRWKCNNCGRRFMDGRKHPKSMVDMAVNLVASGLSTADASIRLHAISGVWVHKMTIARWNRKNGRVRLTPNVRLRPCEYCGATTGHKHSCPVWKAGAHVREEKSYLV